MMSTETDWPAGPVPGPVSDAALLAAIREHAYLEGDFLLRSGKRSPYYLDKFRFETRPELLEQLGARLAARIAKVEPRASRIACPVVGAVTLAAAASLASRLPFLIVRDEAKEYGTANRIEGAFAPGELVVLVEDVVTSGGAAADAVRAVRQAALECRTVICVIDREEGGADCLARLGVRLHPLFRAADVAPPRSVAAKPHG
jgi:orotate phosphoribosyltransferase